MQHVDFLGFQRRHPGRGIGAVIDIFDRIEVRPAINRRAPPFMVGQTGQHAFHANLKLGQRVGAGADQRAGQFGVIAAVHDRGRVIGHARDDRDIRLRQVDLHGQRIDHDNAALARLLRVGIDKRAHARRHRVRLDRLVAPAGDIVGHVLGGEIVAIGPFHAGADLQRVLGGVVIDLPAFQQHAADRPVIVVFGQVFQRATGLVGDLGPVGGAAVFQRAHAHLDTQRAARLHMRGGLGGLADADQPIGRGRRHAQRCGAGQKFAAAQLAGLELLGIHPGCGVQLAVVIGAIGHLVVSSLKVARVLYGIMSGAARASGGADIRSFADWLLGVPLGVSVRSTWRRHRE